MPATAESFRRQFACRKAGASWTAVSEKGGFLSNLVLEVVSPNLIKRERVGKAYWGMKRSSEKEITKFKTGADNSVPVFCRCRKLPIT
jgi:hypothetical protein